MPQSSVPPLDAPPRKAHFRRGVRNLRRAYNSVFLLIIFVLLGWAALDAYHWSELTNDHRIRAAGFALGALLAFAIWSLVDRPLIRELRLARRGQVARGKIVTIAKPPGRRAITVITYAFTTPTGESITAESRLPRRFADDTLAPDMEIDILFDPNRCERNKPRLALEFVVFGELPKKTKLE